MYSKINNFLKKILNKMNIYLCILVLIISFFVVGICDAFIKREKYLVIYNEGKSLLENGFYDKALKKFEEIPDYMNYKDIDELLGLPEICPECGHEIGGENKNEK